MRRRDRRHEAALNRFWNRSARGETDTPPDVDPALVETIRRVQALGAGAAPDPAFVTRLEERLMFHPTANSIVPGIPVHPAAEIGAGQSEPRREEGRRRTLATVTAVAAVALLMLAIGWVAFRPASPGPDAARPRLAAPSLATAAVSAADEQTFTVTVEPGWRMEQIAAAAAAGGLVGGV